MVRMEVGSENVNWTELDSGRIQWWLCRFRALNFGLSPKILSPPQKCVPHFKIKKSNNPILGSEGMNWIQLVQDRADIQAAF
jgi:hypothetical protein